MFDTMLDEMQTTFSCQRYDPRLKWKCSLDLMQPVAIATDTDIRDAVVPKLHRGRLSSNSRLHTRSSSIGSTSLTLSDGIDKSLRVSTVASFTSEQVALQASNYGSKENASERTTIKGRHSLAGSSTLASPYRSISLMMEEMDSTPSRDDVASARSSTRNPSLVSSIPDQTQPSVQFLIDDSIVDIQTVPRWEEIKEKSQNTRDRRHSAQKSAFTSTGISPLLSRRQTALKREKRVWWNQNLSVSHTHIDQTAQNEQTQKLSSGGSRERGLSAVSTPKEGVVRGISLAEAKLKPLPDLPFVDSHSARDLKDWKSSLLFLFPYMPSSRKATPSETSYTADSSSHDKRKGVASFLARCFGVIKSKTSKTDSRDHVKERQEGLQIMVEKEVRIKMEEE